MPDQTPVTDDLAQHVQTVINLIKAPGSQFTQSEIIDHLQALIPAPPATLAEELREWGARPLGGLNWTRFHDLADRVEAVEKENRDMERELNNAWVERDHERAEVKRLTRDRTVKDSRTVALPDPDDVPRGEVWQVKAYDGQLGPALRVNDVVWPLVSIGPEGKAQRMMNHHVTLVSRLVPDTRRVIDRPETLDALPVGSIVLTESGYPYRKNLVGLWVGQVITFNSDRIIDQRGPVTVIHEPMSDSGDSGDGRTPDCPTQG